MSEVQVHCQQDDCLSVILNRPAVMIKVNWLIRCECCSKPMNSLEYDRLYKAACKQLEVSSK